MRLRRDFTFTVERRISDLRQSTKQINATTVDTQFLRNTWITQLDHLFAMATTLAKGGTKPKEDCDKKTSISPRERQLWSHVAAHTAEVMGNLAKGFEERQFDDDLAELEKLVDEIKILQDQSDQQQDQTKEGKSELIETENKKLSDS